MKRMNRGNKMRGWRFLLMAGCVFVTACGQDEAAHKGEIAEDAALMAQDSAQISDHLVLSDLPQLPPSLSGQYLASHFAQSRYDWPQAYLFLKDVAANDPENKDIVRHAMVLSMGTGDIQSAERYAKALKEIDGGNELSSMIIAVSYMREQNWEMAETVLNEMGDSEITVFIRPILMQWVDAALKRTRETESFETGIHYYHAALVAFMIDDKERATALIEELMVSRALNVYETERLADFLVAFGRYDSARVLYQNLVSQLSGDDNLKEKLGLIEGLGDNEAPESEDAAAEIFEKIDRIILKDIKQVTPSKGAGLALYDLALLLHNEFNDGSTKVFSQMALVLDPELTRARLLLANIFIRNENFKDAIAALDAVPADDPAYLMAQRNIAEIMAEQELFDEARARLENIYQTYDDVNALISIGDLYRQDDRFQEAVDAYNRAATIILEDTGLEEIGEEYWNLLYARGMAYERNDQWDKAEGDLTRALEFRPDHPYLLNYLGYSWADQNMNLEQSLELIEKAVSLRPMDGYIIDSLGWVQYRMEMYQEATKSLERAVELLPYDAVINDHLGDAYWKIGRYQEARFQWQRAVNYAEDEELAETVQQKIRFGLGASVPKDADEDIQD